MNKLVSYYHTYLDSKLYETRRITTVATKYISFVTDWVAGIFWEERRQASVASRRFLQGDGTASRSRPNHWLPENRHWERRVGGAAANPAVGNDGQSATAGRRDSFAHQRERRRVLPFVRGIVRSLENYGMVRFDSELSPLSEHDGWVEPHRLDSYSAYTSWPGTTTGFGGIVAPTTAYE